MKLRLLTAVALCATVAAPLLAQAAEGFATANVNMRSGPSTAYPAVTTIPVGAPLDINGCLAETPWCDVSFVGGRGWVAGRYIQAVYQQRRVYVGPEYYGYLGIPMIGFDLDSYWGRYYRGRDFYRDRDRWRNDSQWGSPRNDDNWRRDNGRPDPDWRRRQYRDDSWDGQQGSQPDWNRQGDRRRDGYGQPGGNPDWNGQQGGNRDWNRQPDQTRPNRQPDRAPPPPAQTQAPRPQAPAQPAPQQPSGNAGPYSPGYVPPAGPGGYPCNNPVSDCGPPAPRGSNR